MAKSVAIVCFVAATLFSGCCSAQTPLQSTHRAKCSQSPAGCYEQATRDCRGGSYQILHSESHAGGLLADILPGPVTWYTMSYVCGPSDGKISGWTVATYLEVGNLNWWVASCIPGSGQFEWLPCNGTVPGSDHLSNGSDPKRNRQTLGNFYFQP